MKRILVLLMFIPMMGFSQHKNVAPQSINYSVEGHPQVNDEYYADFARFTITSQSGEVQDSLACINQENYYYIYNFKKVPKEGLYMDTVCYADPFGRLFQIKIFKDQKLVISAEAYYPYKEIDVWRSLNISYINKNLIESGL